MTWKTLNTLKGDGRMMKPVLTPYDLGDGVVAFSTTRKGGCSEGLYASMNVNAFCGDSADAVRANREALADSLGITPERLIIPHQVHGTELRQIGPEFFSLPEDVKRMLLEGIDGVLTAMPGTCVGVSTADCIPVLLHDPVRHAVAAVHAGWRGTLQRIVQKMVAELRAAFLTDPATLEAVIGPGISLARFEVGDEVYAQFAEAGFDMDRIAQRTDKWHIDLPACNRMLLEEAGLASDHIRMSDVCTYDNADLYFSARRLGVETGRIYTGILLNESTSKNEFQ